MLCNCFGSSHRAQPAGRLEHVLATYPMPMLESFDNFLDAREFGVKHRPALSYREAVAVDPDDIDVGGTRRDTFLEDFRAFVDHRVERAFGDFLGRDSAAHDTALA